jgi:peptide deformylase
MILPITKLPAKILRKDTVNVPFPLHKDIKRLIRDMLDTVKKADGIGLAAPQVSRDLNLALVFLEEAGVPAFPLINPKIIHRSRELIEIEEGCLSMPGVFGLVTRPKKVTVEAQDLSGKKITLTDAGWIARVMQHEIDHLHSTLIIDHIKKFTRGKELLPKYQEKK